jgi:LysM repeat protein
MARATARTVGRSAVVVAALVVGACGGDDASSATTTTTEPPATTTTTEPDVVHVVASGETLGVIAQRYGTTVQVIAEANELADPDLLAVGQELVIPKP